MSLRSSAFLTMPGVTHPGSVLRNCLVSTTASPPEETTVVCVCVLYININIYTHTKRRKLMEVVDCTFPGGLAGRVSSATP